MGFPVTTFADTYDWAAVDNLGAFWAAIQERHKIINDGLAAGPSDPFPARLPVAGDFVAGVTGAIAATPLDLSGTLHRPKFAFCIDTIQLWITTYYGLFVATAVGGTPVSNYVGKAALHFWGGAAVGTAENIFAYISTYGTDAAGNHSGFTRQRPARIFTVADTTYDDNAGNTNNVVANGHTAYCNTDGLKYTRTAGVWVLAADQTTLCTVLVGVGTIRAGDYIGPWIWRELYKAIKELRWTACYRTGTLGGITVGAAPLGSLHKSFDRYGNRGSTVSQAAAKAAALGDFNATEADPGGPVGGLLLVNPMVRAYVHDHLSATSPSWDALVECYRANIDITGGGAVASTTPLLARAIDYYYAATQYGSYPLDDLSTAISDLSGNLALWLTEGPTSAAKTESGSTFPSGTTPDWPTTVTVNTAVEHDVDGGVVANGFVVFRWDVLGGLVFL